MPWTDTLDDRQRELLALARIYAAGDDPADGYNRLLLIARLADLLDELLDASEQPSTPLADIIGAALAAGGVAWTIRGATKAALVYTDNPAPDPDTLEDWPGLTLTPPHPIVVLISLPTSDGGAPGIEFHAPAEGHRNAD